MKKIVLLLIAIGFKFNIFSQTTVITHGYSTSSPVNGWMLDMARAIQNRVGGTIYNYNKLTGELMPKEGSGNHSIIIFDWANESTHTDEGYSEQAGAALFTMLMDQSTKNVITVNPLHLIGHSRGCAVNSEAVERLLANNITVNHVTYLDAHDWGQNLGFGVVCADYDVNPDSINSGIEGWSGIVWAEAYWQDKSGFLNEQKGRAVEGCYNEYMGKIGHQGMYEWYTQSAQDTSIKKGYYYSQFGGGKNVRPAMYGIKRNPFINAYSDAVFNGDLQRGPDGTDFAGWRYHGGSGNGLLSDDHLELRNGNNLKIHDRIYFPSSTEQLQFDLRVYTADAGAAGTTDYLRVNIGNTQVLNQQWANVATAGYATIKIDASSFKNSAHQLIFELVDQNGTTSDIDAEVWIDNIKLSSVPVSVSKENKKNTERIMFANPIKSDEVFQIHVMDLEIPVVTIRDISGKVVACVNNNSQVITVPGLNAGMYFISVDTGESSKLIVY